MHKDS